MRDLILQALKDDATRRRLAAVSALALGSLVAAIVAIATPSLAIATEAIDLMAAALVLGADPWIGRLTGVRRDIAIVARFGLIVGLAAWTGLVVIVRCFAPALPAPEAMATVAVLSLTLNLGLVVAIGSAESDPVLAGGRNRALNDLIGGAALLCAAGVVALTASPAADLVVAFVGVALLLTAGVPPLAIALRRLLTAWNAARSQGRGVAP